MATLWVSGKPYRIVRGLNQLDAQIRGYAPRSVPPATKASSWGALADQLHAKSSDHYPHYYRAAFGATAVVCARDFPHAPGLGLDGGVVTEHLRQARDRRLQYIIFNRRITGINYGWQWHTYTGDDPHNTHFHVSSVHTAVADSTAQWSLPGSTPQPVPESTSTFGDGMDFMIVSNPADPHDGGVYIATPAGPIAIGPAEWASVSQPARDSCMKVASFARIQQLAPVATSVTQLQVSDAQFATLTERVVTTVREVVGEEIPDDLDVETHVVAALQGTLGQAALVQAFQIGEDT